MNRIRRHARKIKLAAVLLAILIVCGVVGQLNVSRNLAKIAPDAFAWQEGDCLDISKGESIEGTVEIDNSYVTLKFDYQIDGTDAVSKDSNLHIEIQSLSSPDHRLVWEMVPGTMENKGEIQIDLKAFKGQAVHMMISPKDCGIRLDNIKLSKMYIGS